MFICKGVGSGSRKLLLALSVVLSGVAAQAATIGQWKGNPANQVWASAGNFSSLYSFVSAANTVETTESITPGNLANDNFFIIANPTAAPTASELTTLANWVQAGHILLLFTDPDDLGSVTVANKILAGVYPVAQTNKINVSSTLVGSNVGSVAGSLMGPDPGVMGTPGNSSTHNISTQALGIWQAFSILGGTNLALNNTPSVGFNIGNTLRVDTISLGKIYVFGDRYDSNSNMGLTGASTNGNLSLFLNLLAQQTLNGGGGGPTDAPEPATFALTGLVLAGILALNRRKAI